ncbi:BTB/POZ domain-containing protein At5g48130 [Rhododendron vialii]|uniref:BTB/POZ domain-containing protein At5g48130 n=1 Tax=Rhododendron vialii TaxID=182163 RepID=UPI00265EAF08|nr:BTB/POZ domain-containing protein At5g48130 [Rhododendron vialii]
MAMDTASLKDSHSPVLSSPFSSPNVAALLKIKIISWSQETGLPVSVRVQVADRTFNLHKHPLYSKSGYFKRNLKDSNEIELPQTFPGGPEAFEMIALFIYGSSTLVDPFNVASLRCAAEFLEMTEIHASGNLCDRFDVYLNQVVLQSWDDTLIVLQKCQTLLPLAEELLIVSRCIESLAFMACMEILDPDRRRFQPVVTLEALTGQAWSCETGREILNHDLWIKDLIALPFGFFKRVIGSLRRQGMKEKNVSPIIVFYANKWLVSKKTRQFWENSGERNEDKDGRNKDLVLLEGVLDLLPAGEKGGKMIPSGFCFSLLSRSLELGLDSERMAELQDQIASVLRLAKVEDFLLPTNRSQPISSSIELATMERIFSTYVSSNMASNNTPSTSHSIVADLWDLYLSNIAPDPKMEPKRFMELIETVPISSRLSHDHLYKALNTYLQAHPGISQDDKGFVCKYLNCQKLSQEMCIEAVQNDLMPLRLIVQALFVQQLNTHRAFKECSDSFRYAHGVEFSGSPSSSRYANSKSQNLSESPYIDGGGEAVSRPLSFLIQRDIAIQRSECSRKEYESTSFRIQSLEQELMSLKKNLQLENMSPETDPVVKKSEAANSLNFMPYSSLSRQRNPLGQVRACIGSVNFASHRKYASRIIKVFRRIRLFGRGKSKKEPGASTVWP